MNEKAREQILEAGVALLESIEKTAKAQHRLLLVRADRESSSEQIYDAATAYRSTEAEAQNQLSKLLDLHVEILSEEFGEAEPTASRPEEWKS